MKKEKGSAVLGGIIILALLSVLLISVSFGQLVLEDKRLQKAATLSSIQASKNLAGCTNTNENYSEKVEQTITGFGYKAENIESIRVGKTVRGVEKSIVYDQAPIDTIEVILKKEYIPLFGPKQILTAKATSESYLATAIYAGSKTVNSSNMSFINGIVGANFSVADYQQLSNTNINIGDLKASLGLIKNKSYSESELATLEINQNNLLASINDVLVKNGDALIAGIVDRISGNEVIGIDGLLGSVINSDTIDINLFELLYSIGTIGQTGKIIPINTNLNIAGIQFYIFVKILEPYQIGGGRAGYYQGEPLGKEAQNNQIEILVRTHVTNPATTLGLPLSALLSGDINIGYDLKLSHAKASLASISCPSPHSDIGVDVEIGTAQVKAGTFSGNPFGNNIGNPNPPPLTAGKLIGINLLLLQAELGLQNTTEINLAGNNQYITLSGEPFPTPIETTSNNINISETISNLNNGLLSSLYCTPINICSSIGVSVGSINNLILNPISAVIEPVLESTLNGLGVQVAGADVWADRPVYRFPVVTKKGGVYE